MRYALIFAAVSVFMMFVALINMPPPPTLAQVSYPNCANDTQCMANAKSALTRAMAEEKRTKEQNTQKDETSNAVGAFVLVGLLLFFYLLPTVNAFSRRHRNRAPIFVINIFLGWTFLGWVIALAWSFSADVDDSDIQTGPTTTMR